MFKATKEASFCKLCFNLPARKLIFRHLSLIILLIVSGIGQIRLNPGHSVSYNIQVTVTHRYYILLRYSLLPSTWLNTLFLYDAEVLTWSGSDLVSSYITSLDRPSLWKVTIQLLDSTNSQLLSSTLSVAGLSVGEGKTWNDSSVITLTQGLNYRLTMTYEAVGNAGSPWPLIIDSVVLLPDFTQNSYYTSQSETKKGDILNCRVLSESLSSSFQLPGVCRQHIFGVSTEMYNGSLGTFLID